MVTVLMEASALLCLCGLAIRRPLEHLKEYGFHTNYLNWKEKLIDSNPNIKFTTVCSFEPSNFSLKYNDKDWLENENITSFDEIKKRARYIFRGKSWGFHSVNELDLSNLKHQIFNHTLQKIRFEIGQIFPAIRMKHINERIVSFDNYDYVIFLRPDCYFTENVLLKENSMSIVGNRPNPGTPAAGIYFCTLQDWDYCWFGSSKIMEEWITHFSNLNYIKAKKIQKIANKTIDEKNKKFVVNRFEEIDKWIEHIYFLENYLYNFKYINQMQYEGIAKLGHSKEIKCY